jgi:gamma-glutamylcyclotransferase (GGCT)/AIG2-like uncharacterized protein YtfP
MISSRLTRRDSLLFVYGTLRSFVDIPMAQWLRRRSRYVGSATTRGRLYDLGPYPALRPARARGETVAGDVYRVTNPRVFRVLDRYEAGDARARARFTRARCVVTLSRGARKSAWAYHYRRSVVAAARIASGDYRVHCRARAADSLERRPVAAS